MLAGFALLLGLSLLLAGGGAMVRGASGIAAQFGVSPMIVGLTIVAFGTSAPELFINAIGAIQGETELAFGNVVGSNLANLGLVLGLAALVSPINIDSKIVIRELPLLMLATLAIVVMAADPLLRGLAPVIDRSDALILLLIFGVFMYNATLDVLRPDSGDHLLQLTESVPLAHSEGNSLANTGFLLGGILGLFIGGQFTVKYGVEISEMLGVPSAVVGLFVVAIGTSLPELVTSIIAAMRGDSDLALGNVVGSNLFNCLMVLPISVLLRPVEVPAGGLADLGMSLAFAMVLIPVFWIGRSQLNRGAGAALVLTYLAYAVWRFI